MEYKVKLNGLDCPNCAMKIEDEIKKLSFIDDCKVNFSNLTCIYSTSIDNDKALAEIKKIINSLEPDVIVEDTNHLNCDCHNHTHEHSSNNIKFIILGFLLFILGFIFKDVSTIFFLLSYFVLGFDVLKKSVLNIKNKDIFDENFLMSIATIAAIFLKDYKEAVVVMLLYQIGESFQNNAVDKSRKSIKSLMNIKPEYAFVLKNNEFIKVKPEELKINETILVKAGEKIAVDGIVVDGSSLIDTSSLNGESLPVEVLKGSSILSGSINLSGTIKVIVSKEYKNSTVSKILELIENSTNTKAKSEKFITKFSKIYTPIVVGISILLVIILPFFNVSFKDALERACTLLVISCPCALVISIPLGFYSGIGGLSKNNILIKGSNIIETLSNVKNIVLDKTGTLTEGKFFVEEVIGGEDVLEIASYAEYNSNHPIAKSILKEYNKNIDSNLISNVKEFSGYGISLKVKDDDILVGNANLLRKHGIDFIEVNKVGSIVYVCKNNKHIGSIIINDKIKEDSYKFVNEVKDKEVFMVTGDNENIAKNVGEKLNIKNVYSNCLPDKKYEIVENIKKSGITLFAGDGINDAPVLNFSDVGVCMGNIGSDISIDASDVIIMDDKPSKILFMIEYSKKILSVVNQNIIFAIGIKLLFVLLGIFGLTNMWLAIFADVGVSILCILNSIRLLNVKKY